MSKSPTFQVLVPGSSDTDHSQTETKVLIWTNDVGLYLLTYLRQRGIPPSLLPLLSPSSRDFREHIPVIKVSVWTSGVLD